MSEPLKETNELADLVLTLVKAGAKSAEDGKLGLADAENLLPVIGKVGPALSGVGKVGAELSAASEEALAGLATKVVTELAVGNEKTKKVVEKALKAAIAIHELVKAVKEAGEETAPVSAEPVAEAVPATEATEAAAPQA